jgi:TonB family protein
LVEELMMMKKYAGQVARVSCGAAAFAIMLGQPLSPAEAQGRGALSGTVTDSAGSRIAGAEVSLVGTSTRAHTDTAGAFRFTRLASGDVQVQVRRLGYAPRVLEVRVAPDAAATMAITLAAIPYSLTPITVTERREVFDSRLAGFNSRRQRGAGYFYTREQLDQKSHRLADVLREIPGVRIRPIPGAGRTVSMRGNCNALIVIDGTPATAGAFDLDMLDLASFEAVEVYSSSSTVPHELGAGRGSLACGLVALWSRPARPRNVARGAASGSDVRTMVEAGSVHSPDTVDEPAQLVGAVAPLYPEVHWRQGTSGRVLLEFVVNERGEVETGTVTTVSATDGAFAAAARAVLPSARFSPAVHQGRAVRQVVHLPIEFRPSADPASGDSVSVGNPR